MKSKWLLIGLAGLILLLAWGCEKSPTGIEFDTDEEALQQYVIDNPDGYFSCDDHYGLEDTTTVENETKGEKRYTLWWRMPTDIERDITIHIENDSAFVTFSAEVTGVFNLLVWDTLPPDTIINHPKEMHENFVRYAIFKHYSNVSKYRGWKLEKVTGVDITSDPNTVEIDSVRIKSDSYGETVITQSLEFFGRDEILTFHPDEEVTLTVYSADSIYPFLHARGRNFSLRRWWRWRFRKVEDGVWELTWRTPLRNLRIRPLIFDILHKDTIDDNEYQYDSKAWIFPYRIVE